MVMKRRYGSSASPLTEEQRAEQELTRKRRDYQKATANGITLAEAVEKITTIFKEANVRGFRSQIYSGYEDISLRVERSFSVAADLFIRFSTDYDSKIVNPDNNRQSAGRYKVNIEISWSGTSRSIAACVASIALYQELTNLAAEVQAMLGYYDVRWVWDLDAKAVEVPVPEAPKDEKYEQ